MSVTVESALDQLISQVTAYGLPKGLTNALTVKLEAALASWTRGRSNAAVNQIEGFIHEVDAKRGKALTDAQARHVDSQAEIVVQAIRTEPSQRLRIGESCGALCYAVVALRRISKCTRRFSAIA